MAYTRIGMAASLIGASYKWMDDAWKTLQSPRTGKADIIMNS